MARATRSKPKPKEATPEPQVSTVKPLPSSTSNPPKLFVFPKDTSKDARIVTLESPATGAPSKYFFCPDKGFYEFTRIAAPKKDCRSCLITVDKSANEEQKEDRIGTGYITKSADLFIATPIDLLFLILPALAPRNAKETKQHFLAADDYIDKLYTSSRHWRSLVSQNSALKSSIEKKLRATCDTVDAGDETMYRLSHPKLLAMLLKKAERMVKNGLPPSLEDKYIKTALEVPVMNIKREDSSLSTAPSTQPTENDSQPSTTTTTDSQDTTITAPDTDTDAHPKPALSTPPQIPHLLRLRTSLTYLTTTYLPPTLATPTTALLPSHTTPSFAPLTAHLSSLASLRTEAAALRSISDNISRKRAAEDDDDDRAYEREEKKRKKEEEEKRKKSEGRAVKMLKKVDTSGMKKMSAFFTKVPKKA